MFQVVLGLDVAEDQTRVALLVFSETVQLRFGLNRCVTCFRQDHVVPVDPGSREGPDLSSVVEASAREY